MTCVVYDKKNLAVDSRGTLATAGTHKCSVCDSTATLVKDDKQKLILGGGCKFRGETVIAMAGAGSATAIRHIIDYIKKDEDFELLITNLRKYDPQFPSIMATVMVVTEAAVYRVSGHRDDDIVKKHSRDEYVTIGSGGNAAKMAMIVSGCDAKEAVALASNVDEGTGGKIWHYDCIAKDGVKTLDATSKTEVLKKTQETYQQGVKAVKDEALKPLQKKVTKPKLVRKVNG